MSCGVGRRRGSDPAILRLWRRPVATAPKGHLAWEPPYATGAAQENDKKTKTKKEEKSQIDNITHHLNELEKEEQTKPKVIGRKEIMKIKEGINKIETQKTTDKINKTKSWFFEKVNKIDKPLARLTKRREKMQINKIRNEKKEKSQLILQKYKKP